MSDKPKKLKGFAKHQNKYADQVEAFNLAESSSISECGIVDYEQREATDVFFGGCCCLFSIVWVAIVVFFVSKGNLDNAIAIYESNDKQCATGNYFFITDVSSSELQTILNSGYCVSECPAKGKALACTDKTGKCPSATAAAYDSEPWAIISTICFPTNTDYLNNNPAFAELSKDLKKFSSGFLKYSPILVASFAFATLLNLLYIKLMSAHPITLAKVSVVFVILFLVLNIAIAAYIPHSSVTDSVAASQLKSIKIGCYVWAGVNLLVMVIFLCYLHCYREQLDIAIQIVDTAADFYNATLRLFFVSCWTFNIHLWSLVLLVAGITLAAYMSDDQSTYKASISVGATDGAHISFMVPNKTTGAVAGGGSFLVLQYIWINIFASQALTFTAMYSAASYYFSSEGDLVVGSAQVTDGLKLSMSKHFGSIALGSFIKVVIVIINNIIENAESEGEGGGAAVLACIITCVMSCVEGAIEMLTNVAYANQAISGDSFCKSAWSGFMIALRHLIKFIFAARIASFIVFMGSMVIFFSTMGFTYGILTVAIKDLETVTKITMVVAAGFIAILANTMFLGLFDEAILATLQCVAIDMDFNGGHPKYGSSSFQANMQIILDRDDGKNQGYAPVVDTAAPVQVAPAPVANYNQPPQQYNQPPQQYGQPPQQNAGYGQPPPQQYNQGPPPQQNAGYTWTPENNQIS